MSALHPIDPLDVIREARAHLECGVGQSVPSDDQIIIGHMRSASELLALVIEASVTPSAKGGMTMSDVREKIDTSNGACAIACMLVSDPRGSLCQDGWQRRVNDLIRALRDERNGLISTMQTILDLLNPLHGSVDLQTYDERYREGFDAPCDAEYDVTVTAQQERDLTQAVLILEDRLRSAKAAPALPQQESGE